jgi:rare lipoprotein A
MTGRIKNSRGTALRTFGATLALCALAATTNAADAADGATAHPFAGAFADLGAPNEVALPNDAVDLTTLAPAEAADADSDVLADPMPSGMASWYGAELAGHRTASGDRFNPDELTAAHRTLPLGSRVRVTYQGKSVVVRINDRGPFARGRVIDLSRAAAEQIGLRRAGSGQVELARLAS